MAAYNEERFIELPLRSVVAQTSPQLAGSSFPTARPTGTDDLVCQYARQYPVLQSYRIVEDHPRNFVAQVNAINTGFNQLRGVDCDFIGNLDADISLDATYFERLVQRLDADPGLGSQGDLSTKSRTENFAHAGRIGANRSPTPSNCSEGNASRQSADTCHCPMADLLACRGQCAHARMAEHGVSRPACL